MAEGFARQMTHGRVRVFSAAAKSKSIHPLTFRVMHEASVDISRSSTKTLAEIPLENLDHVITLCGDVEEGAPTPNLSAKRLYWPIAVPASTEGSEEQILAKFRQVRDQIHKLVVALLTSE